MQTMNLTTAGVLLSLLLQCGNPLETAEKPTPSEPITDVDGNIYNTIKIGTQIWTVENLRTTRFNDGTPIPQVTDSAEWDNLTTPGYCYYSNTVNRDSITKFGALYNWYAAQTGKIAPEGWHVPDSVDWIALEDYLIYNGYNFEQDSIYNRLGKALAATTDWKYYGDTGTVGYEPGKNNSSCFTGLPGGTCGSTLRNAGQYIAIKIGEVGAWWGTSEADPESAWRWTLSYDGDMLYREYDLKSCGASIRLVKNKKNRGPVTGLRLIVSEQDRFSGVSPRGIPLLEIKRAIL